MIQDGRKNPEKNRRDCCTIRKRSSDDRIKGIEDSMKLFEEGTEKYADAIKQEFGNMFSEDTVYALAANAFALDA